MEYREQTLFIDGELTKYTVPALNDKFLKLKSEQIIAVDLQEIAKIDSAGVAFIDELIAELRLDPGAGLIMNEMVLTAYNTFSSS